MYFILLLSCQAKCLKLIFTHPHTWLCARSYAGRIFNSYAGHKKSVYIPSKMRWADIATEFGTLIFLNEYEHSQTYASSIQFFDRIPPAAGASVLPRPLTVE